MIKTPSNTNGKTYAESSNIVDSKFDRTRNQYSDRNGTSKFNYNKTSSIGIDRGIDRSSIERPTLKAGNNSTSKLGTTDMFQGIPSKKLCGEHIDE